MRFVKRLFAVAVIAGLAAAAVFMIGGGQSPKSQWKGKGFRGEGPVAVLIAPSKTADVPVYLDGVGTVRARNTVTVRPQVDGQLLSIDFKEGQNVKKGDVLARIDPATYQAQLDQAAAKKRLTEVQLENAKRDLARLTRLNTSVVAEKTVDTQRAQVAQLEAQIKADDAAIANARAVLDYTTILAPIDGRTGLRMADVGNLVRASDAGIVVITEVQPISVTFTLPQQQLQTVNAAFSKGPLKADAMDTSIKTVIDSGELIVVDNIVDSQTGTVRLKADFPNADLKLWPGQFVNVRLLVETLNQVVTVPSPAIQRGPAGAFVFVLNSGGDTVALRQVTLGPVDDRVAIITKGVAIGESVVTSGFGRLADGVKVTAQPASEATPSEPAVKAPAAGAAVPPAVTGSTGRPEGRAEGRSKERQKGEGGRGAYRKDASNDQRSTATP